MIQITKNILKIVTGLILPHPAQLLALFTNSLLAIQNNVNLLMKL